MRRYLILSLTIILWVSGMANDRDYLFNELFSMSVSDNLELRADNDAYTQFLNGALNYNTDAEIVFQQKGLSKKSEVALSRYCRIMVMSDVDDSCPYPSSDESCFSKEDLDQLLAATSLELAEGQTFVKSPICTIKETKSGSKYVDIQYSRTGTKGDVDVEICYFFNYDSAVKAIFSYRESERALWQQVLANARASFAWKSPHLALNSNLDTTNKTDFDSDENGLSSDERQVMAVSLCIVLAILLVVLTIVYLMAKRNNRRDHKKQQIENLIREEQKTLQESKVKETTETVLISKPSSSTPRRRSNKYRQNNQEESLAFVNYELPKSSDTDHYSFYTAPTRDTVVFPYRRGKVARRGFSEANFEKRLKKYFKSAIGYAVLGDTSIHPSGESRPYEPDLAIIETGNKYGIRIDVEIDEPYGGYDRNPIHYIDCGDGFRDRNLANIGWIVVRFSEKQIVREPDECVHYLQDLIHLIDQDFVVTLTCGHPSPDKRWSEIEAKKMALAREREKLLNHNFGEQETNERIALTEQTKLERLAAEKVKPLQLPCVTVKNLDMSEESFAQDGKLSFDPKEHIYLYEGKMQLTAVSNVVSMFFYQFDALGKSRNYAERYGLPQMRVMEKWDCNGLESREVGSFLHAQIEAFFANAPINLCTRFVYPGEYVNVDKEVSIETEFSYFKNFLKKNPITPFRTEWHIFDLDLKIAGTIDLLCRNGNHFDIYDWKRSKNASPNKTVWQYGNNGLEDVPDISFYHYALQQNLYKYILEKNYGIVVDNMYIVVLHPLMIDYQKYEIPIMNKELQIIKNHLLSN